MAICAVMGAWADKSPMKWGAQWIWQAEDGPKNTRANGDVGVRNEIWSIPTVGCVNELAEQLFEQVADIASGSKTANEKNGCLDFSIWKSGVTL